MESEQAKKAEPLITREGFTGIKHNCTQTMEVYFLKKINKKVNKLLISSENTAKILEAIDKETTAIAVMIEQIISEVENNVVTKEQLAVKFDPLIVKLKSIGNTN